MAATSATVPSTTPGTNGKAPPGSRFALQQHVRVELDGGDWLLLRGAITYGQSLRITDAARLDEEGRVTSLHDYYLARAAAWVADWGGPGFTDADGDGVPVSPEALENLTPATGGAVQRALDAHVAEVELGKAATAPAATGASPPS